MSSILRVRCPHANDPKMLSLAVKVQGVSLELARPLDGEVGDTLRRLSLNLHKKLTPKSKKAHRGSNKTKTPCEIACALMNANGAEVGHGTRNAEAFSTASELEIRLPDGLLKSQTVKESEEAVSRHQVHINDPEIHKLTLPKGAMVGVPQTPRLELCFTSESETTWLWQAKSQGDGGLTIIGDSRCIVPAAALVGKRLVCTVTPRKRSVVGLPVTVTSGTVMEAPTVSAWSARCNNASTIDVHKNENDPFKVICWNILANRYCTTEYAMKELYPYCDKRFLDREYRENLIIAEILNFKPRIVCLQEVEQHTFENRLLPTLSSMGYSGNLATKEVNGEGCAIFYDSMQLTLLSHTRISLRKLFSEGKHSDLFCPTPEAAKTSEIFARIKTVGQVSVFVREIDSGTKKYIVVLNTHLYFHPRAAHIRSIHMAVLTREVDEILNGLACDPDDKHLIVCGDLNSTPETGVVEYLVKGRLSEWHVEWEGFKNFAHTESLTNIDNGNTEEEKEVSMPQKQRRGNLPIKWLASEVDQHESIDSHRQRIGPTLEHPFKLQPVHSVDEMHHNSSNYTSGFVGWLDYIFVTGGLKTLSAVSPPSEEFLASETALPSTTFPSDHIPIVATLSFRAHDN